MQRSANEATPARVALIGGIVTFAFHALLAGRYDLFRDELYFIVCGQHPSFGYVDQPPLVPLAAAALYKLGLGAWGLRLPVAAAAGALAWLTGTFARKLGGGTVAVAVATLATAIAPMLMGLTATLNTSAFDPLCWTAVALLVVYALREDNDRALIWAGAITGITLEIKYAILFWIVGLVLGLLLTPQRRILLRPALWIGAALAAAIAAPSFVWQMLHGFPFLELGEAAGGKNAAIPLGSFLTNQVMVMNPAFAPLWIAGLVAPFIVKPLKDLRFIPIACLIVFAIVRIGHGKDYYLSPLYPSLFAIGTIALAGLVRARLARIVAGIAVAGGVAVSAAAAPIALPILSPSQLVHYIERTGISPQKQERSFKGTVLPQTFADQLGWHDFTRQVEAAWAKIPTDERARTAIKVDNYGEAAALDIYGRGLPPVLSGHNQYYLWGLRGQDPVNVMVVQFDLPSLRPHCRSTKLLGKTYSRFAMAYENDKVIALCIRVKPSLQQLWPTTKHFG